jgi:lipopolysaccharide biosynthesis protein
MKITAAVVAHFDLHNKLDPTFKMLIECLKTTCTKVVLVTTSNLKSSEIPQGITTIQRPNFGYDFYSYRVGIDEIERQGGCTNLLLVNSSFFVLNSEKLNSTLLTILKRLEDSSVVSLTASNQIAWHFQSYLIGLRGEVLTTQWFKNWREGIAPTDSKMDAILAYELGLSRAVIESGVTTSTIFEPTPVEKSIALTSWREWQQAAGESTLDDNYNATHFNAQPIAEQHGIVKVELLRNNPHSFNIDWVEGMTPSASFRDITNYIARSREAYQANENGLTALATKHGGIPSFRKISTGPLARKGVRIAVVVHLFYIELLDEICQYLKNIIEPFDLFITTPFEGFVSTIIDCCEPIAQTVMVAVLENRGRDMAPFVALHRAKLLDPYVAVLKLHSKKSGYSGKGGSWRNKLFDELCGNYQSVQKTITLLARNDIGIVGPHDFYLKNEHFWGGNRASVHRLLSAMGIKQKIDDIPLGFFGGSMFWFAPKAIKLLHDIPEDLLIFEDEGGQRDGTLAHAIERIFSNVATHSKFASTSIKLAGENIHEIASITNTVPVLTIPIPA